MTIGHAWELGMFEGPHALTTPIRPTSLSAYREELIMTYTAYSADTHSDSDPTGRRWVMDLVKEIADDRKHDPYGSAMLALGAIVDALTAEGIGIPSFIASGSMGIDWDNPEHEQAQHLWQSMADGYYSADDLAYGMFVVSRYIDIVRMAGRDY